MGWAGYFTSGTAASTGGGGSGCKGADCGCAGPRLSGGGLKASADCGCGGSATTKDADRPLIGGVQKMTHSCGSALNSKGSDANDLSVHLRSDQVWPGYFTRPGQPSLVLEVQRSTPIRRNIQFETIALLGTISEGDNDFEFKEGHPLCGGVPPAAPPFSPPLVDDRDELPRSTHWFPVPLDFANLNADWSAAGDPEISAFETTEDPGPALRVDEERRRPVAVYATPNVVANPARGELAVVMNCEPDLRTSANWVALPLGDVIKTMIFRGMVPFQWFAPRFVAHGDRQGDNRSTYSFDIPRGLQLDLTMEVEVETQRFTVGDADRAQGILVGIGGGEAARYPRGSMPSSNGVVLFGGPGPITSGATRLGGAFLCSLRDRQVCISHGAGAAVNQWGDHPPAVEPAPGCFRFRLNVSVAQQVGIPTEHLVEVRAPVGLDARTFRRLCFGSGRSPLLYTVGATWNRFRYDRFGQPQRDVATGTMFLPQRSIDWAFGGCNEAPIVLRHIEEPRGVGGPLPVGPGTLVSCGPTQSAVLYFGAVTSTCLQSLPVVRFRNLSMRLSFPWLNTLDGGSIGGWLPLPGRRQREYRREATEWDDYDGAYLGPVPFWNTGPFTFFRSPYENPPDEVVP